MLAEKKVIPYKVQKGNRPKIEEVISSCLDGEMKENALNFAMWMREKKMPFKLTTSNTRFQRCDYKGWTLCYIRIYHTGDPVDDVSPDTSPFWMIIPTLQLMHNYKDVLVNEHLTSIQWDEVSNCRRKNGCNCGHTGVDRTIFNKEYQDICKWRGLKVRNPDKATIEMLKRLLELDQKARDTFD